MSFFVPYSGGRNGADILTVGNDVACVPCTSSSIYYTTDCDISAEYCTGCYFPLRSSVIYEEPVRVYTKSAR